MSTITCKFLSTLTLAMAVTIPAHATILSASSNGYGLDTSVGILGSITLLDINLLGLASGLIPPGSTYTDHANPNLDMDVNLLAASAHAGADLLYGNASFDGTTVAGNGGVEQLDLNARLLGLLPILDIPLLDLSIGTLDSISSITGDYGSLSWYGESTITELSLSIFGTPIGLDASLYAHAAPNTVIDIASLLDVAGATLVLNEQNVSGDCASSVTCSIETNALHLTVDALDLGLANIDLIVGHSYAEVGAEPTPPNQAPLPGTLLLMGTCLGPMVYFMRRHTNV